MQNNSFSSQRRLINLEGIFSKDANLAGTYKNVIYTFVSLKHERELSKEEIDTGPAGRLHVV
jgi:hypothetical protein